MSPGGGECRGSDAVARRRQRTPAHGTDPRRRQIVRSPPTPSTSDVGRQRRLDPEFAKKKSATSASSRRERVDLEPEMSEREHGGDPSTQSSNRGAVEHHRLPRAASSDVALARVVGETMG